MPRAGGRIAVVALAAALALGFAVKDDFGISWDEPTLHEYGALVLESVREGSRRFENLHNLRYYGPLVPVGLALLDRAFDGRPASAYAYAHLANYCVFLAGVAAFCALCRRHFGRDAWGFLGAAMLVLSPRVFSHAFVNPKDIPFLSLLVVNVWLLSVYLETRRARTLVGLSVATAALVAVRVLGVGFFGLALLALGAVLRAWRWRRLSFYALSAAALSVALWPFLWGDPLARFIEALREAAHIRGVPASMLFGGRIVSTQAVPWHYMPTWIAITTPLPYLALACLGLFATLARFRTLTARSLVAWSGLWLVGPLLAVLLLRPVVYDEWRQLLFVYPALVVFALEGLRWLWQALPRGRPLLLAGVVAALGATAATMVRLHPYEAVYFNALAGGTRGAEGRYELDYWGLSYREGLRYLLRSRGGPVRVAACTAPARSNALWFDDGFRLKFRPPEEAEFAVCASRQSASAYLPEKETLFTVSRDGATLLSVKRLAAPAR